MTQRRHDKGSPGSKGGQFAQSKRDETTDGLVPPGYTVDNSSPLDETVQIGYRFDGQYHDLPDGTPALTMILNDGARYEAHYEHGVIQDPGENLPAQTWYNPDGVMIMCEYRQSGVQQDPPDGSAAHQEYWTNGEPREFMHFQDGHLQDGPNNEPAKRSWFIEGGLKDERRYQAGKLHDGPGGAAAESHYTPDGTLVSEWHYQDGRLQE